MAQTLTTPVRYTFVECQLMRMSPDGKLFFVPVAMQLLHAGQSIGIHGAGLMHLLFGLLAIREGRKAHATSRRSLFRAPADGVDGFNSSAIFESLL